MTELEVRLSADISKLKAELAKAKKEVEGFGVSVEKESNKAGAGFVKAGSGAAEARPKLAGFNSAVTQVSGSLGTAGIALRGVVGALSGPGGMVLLLGAVAQLMVTYSDRLKAATKATDDLARKTAEFVGNAQSEIEVLRTLIDVASDENQSKKVRLGALDRINEKYSVYLGNLDLETLKTDAVKNSVDALSKSLIKQAQVRGVEALIQEKFKDSAEDLIKLQLQQKEAATAVSTEVNKLRNSVAAFNSVSKDLPLTQQIKEIEDIVNRAGGSGSGQLRFLGSLLGQFNAAVKETKEFKGDLANELKPIQDLLSSLTIEDLFSEFNVDDNGITVFANKIKNKLDSVKNDFQNLDDIFGVNKAAQKSLDNLTPIFDNFNVKFNKFGDIIQFSLKNAVSKMKPQLAEMEKLMIQFDRDLSEVINNSIQKTFIDLGNAIGNALAGGANVLEAIGFSIVGAFGGFLSAMGELMISYGTLAITKGILDKVIASGGPQAIAAGAAAIAVGVALTSIGSAIQNKAAGGFSSSGQGSVAGQGSSGRSSFSGGGQPSGSSRGGEFVFRIRGRELIGVIENELAASKRLGGAGAIIA